MNTIPTIAEAESAISEHLRNSARPAADPIKVNDIVACYSEQAGFELYAVVDGAGGISIPMDGMLPPLLTVNRRLMGVAAMESAWIGESVVAGCDTILIAARGGDALPTIEACRKAVERHAEITAFGATFRATLSELSTGLGSAEQKIQATIILFVQFEELAGAVASTASHLAALGELWQRFHRLETLHLERRIDNLWDAIDAETSQLACFRRDVESRLTDLGTSLAGRRADYEVLAERRRHDRNYRESERRRINSEYCDALFDPQAVEEADASHEYAEIEELMKAEVDDADSLVRRLLTLRLRCLKALSVHGDSIGISSLVEDIDTKLGRRDQEAFTCVLRDLPDNQLAMDL